MDVAILLYEGFDELDGVAPYEVFRTAAAHGADVDATLRTLVPSERVTASHGLRVEPDDVLLGTPDLVVVPGGGWNSVAPEGQRGGDCEAQRASDRSSGQSPREDGEASERARTARGRKSKTARSPSASLRSTTPALPSPRFALARSSRRRAAC
ncbi:hypothetical protein GJ634_02815 [Halobacterium sp. CBA1126]|nr:hypothetical protein [Halobacterium sp. CBA1126]